MLQIIRSNSNDVDFVFLVKHLDAYLKIVDGDDHDFYNQFNKIDDLKHVVLAYSNNKVIGCGAFKRFDTNTVEIKRMFTLPEMRNQGVASKILNELELWAEELNYNSSILETGKKQVEAIKVYGKNGYHIISNFGQYRNSENSLCFKKKFKQ